MSKKPPPQVLFNFEEDKVDDVPLNDTGEENPNFIYSDDEEPEGAKEELIQMEIKEEMKSNDIFDDMDEEAEPPPPKKEKKVKPVKEKKPRKPMTEEHKAKLALARDKAVLVRRANAIENKKMKDLESEEKELLKTQKIKRVKKLKEDVDNDEEPTIQKVSKNTGITKKDLEEAQLDAIIKYEAIRKERKAKKKEEQMIQEGKAKMLNTIQRATGQYNYRDGSNRFDNCY